MWYFYVNLTEEFEVVLLVGYLGKYLHFYFSIKFAYFYHLWFKQLL